MVKAYLFKSATIVDGSGAPAFETDVAVSGDRITQVGPVAGPAGDVIDGSGLVLAPGFIDIHSHTDATIFENPSAESKLLQGVTLEVTGNCGLGCFPVSEDRRELLLGFLKMHDFRLPGQGLTWRDMRTFADALETLGLGVNLAPLVAHGPLRMAVMGSDDRAPEPGEMQAMKELLSSQLSQGAWGLSTGLIYPPGSYAAAEELIELAAVLAKHGAMYSSHIRGEASTLLDAIDEAIRIGRATGVRTQVSHLKALGLANWGKGREALDRLNDARQAGVDIAADQYPYAASQTALSVLIPEWAHAGGVAAMLERLGDGQATDAAALGHSGGDGRARRCPSASAYPARARTATARCAVNHLAQVASALGRLARGCGRAGGDGRSGRGECGVFLAVRGRSCGDYAERHGGGRLRRRGPCRDGRQGRDAPARLWDVPAGARAFRREKGMLPLATAIYKMTGLPARQARRPGPRAHRRGIQGGPRAVRPRRHCGHRHV